MDEIVFSTPENHDQVARQVAAQRFRNLGPQLYTSNMSDNPNDIIKRHIWSIVAFYCPDGVICDRTALESKPARDGSVFVITKRKRDVKLPGLWIRPRAGAGPTPHDKAFMGLHMACRGRSLLENMKPSRARAGVARTLDRREIENLLEKWLQAGTEEALNRIRDESRSVAKELGMNDEMQQLDALIGALLGSRPDHKLETAASAARQQGHPYDLQRVDLFGKLREHLAGLAPNVRPEKELSRTGRDHLAFFESYFSNFIEGTEFEVDEAAEIVFDNKIPDTRPEDAHDVLGTFRVTSDLNEMRHTPASYQDLKETLERRHRVVMEFRPDKKPGVFKEIPNRAGNTVFVEPKFVEGTLQAGFEMYKSLPDAFTRSVFMMFMVSEVHPFLDGNGRVARIMMNAELVAAGEQRLIIPTVYRGDYMQSLKALSTWTVEPLSRVLNFAQRYTASIPWESFDEARFTLDKTHAFRRSSEADEEGLRLKIPTADILQDAEEHGHTGSGTGFRI